MQLIGMLDSPYVRRKPLGAGSRTITQAGITSAVAWQFTQMMLPEVVVTPEHPTLQAFSAQAEQLAEFVAAPPMGPGVMANP